MAAIGGQHQSGELAHILCRRHPGDGRWLENRVGSARQHQARDDLDLDRAREARQPAGDLVAPGHEMRPGDRSRLVGCLLGQLTIVPHDDPSARPAILVTSLPTSQPYTRL